jgi:septum formation protein
VRLILASASPRRAELLTASGYVFDVHAVDIDEHIRVNETAMAYVERLAAEKSARALGELSNPADQPPPRLRRSAGASAKAEAESHIRDGASDDLIVIGADTAVVVGHDILGKPHDAEDAARMLRRLSGRTHQVMTGVSLRSVTAALSHVEISAVTFTALTEDQVAWYVASGEWRDKAGAYAIQGLAARFIPRIEGSYANVVGLPIAVVERLIQRLGSPRTLLASGE